MYKEFHLGGPLEPFVECAWVLSHPRNGDRANGAGASRRILPDGCTDLVVTLGKSVEFFGPAISFRDVANDDDFAGLRLRPGAAAALIGAAAEEIANQSVSLAAIWGQPGRDIEDRLASATRPDAVLSTLESALAKPALAARDRDSAVLEAVDRLRRFPGTKVNQLAADFDLSERQLRRRFLRHVGLNMKQLGRIIRFQRFVDGLRIRRRRFAGSPPSWAGLACDHGYADQAHLIRESRAIAGATPAELLMNC